VARAGRRISLAAHVYGYMPIFLLSSCYDHSQPDQQKNGRSISGLAAHVDRRKPIQKKAIRPNGTIGDCFFPS
jgi:hypothetical protein